MAEGGNILEWLSETHRQAQEAAKVAQWVFYRIRGKTVLKRQIERLKRYPQNIDKMRGIIKGDGLRLVSGMRNNEE